jgi:hypothetical protein
MEEQVSLFEEVKPAPTRRLPTPAKPGVKPFSRQTWDERCADFDRAHPEVYAEIRRLAVEAYQQGRKRIGIGHLVEVARWNLSSAAKDGDGYKVNNSYRAIWVRRLIAEIPALAPMFELRERRAA